MTLRNQQAITLQNHLPLVQSFILSHTTAVAPKVENNKYTPHKSRRLLKKTDFRNPAKNNRKQNNCKQWRYRCYSHESSRQNDQISLFRSYLCSTSTAVSADNEISSYDKLPFPLTTHRAHFELHFPVTTHRVLFEHTSH